MDVALQSSVWVTSPEFAGYLQKRGFHVSVDLMKIKAYTLSNYIFVSCYGSGASYGSNDGSLCMVLR